MDDREHLDSLSNDSVDDAVAPLEYFSDILALCLRYDAAKHRKVVSRSARVMMVRLIASSLAVLINASQLSSAP